MEWWQFQNVSALVSVTDFLRLPLHCVLWCRSLSTCDTGEHGEQSRWGPLGLCPITSMNWTWYHPESNSTQVSFWCFCMCDPLPAACGCPSTTWCHPMTQQQLLPAEITVNMRSFPATHTHKQNNHQKRILYTISTSWKKCVIFYHVFICKQFVAPSCPVFSCVFWLKKQTQADGLFLPVRELLQENPSSCLWHINVGLNSCTCSWSLCIWSVDVFNEHCGAWCFERVTYITNFPVRLNLKSNKWYSYKYFS